MYQAEVKDRRNAQENAYRLRLSLEREQKTNEEATRKLQAESDALRQEADNLRTTLTEERKAREDIERKYHDTEDYKKLKAQLVFSVVYLINEVKNKRNEA